MRILLLLLTVVALGQPAARAQEQQIHRSHAITIHGEPKYGPGFEHFDYLDPAAPKGGMLRLSASGTFDSFHPFIRKGTPGPTSSVETLLVQSADEASSEYGLIAESIEWPEDRSWVIFHLRPEARWHDGKPITVEDVIWSFDTLKSKGRPRYRFYYANVTGAEKVGERSVKFSFTESHNRELPVIIGQLPVLPKHYWEGLGPDAFEKTTLTPPLASGPYRIAEFEPGRFVVLERVEDYWGRDLPVRRGQNNFDRIRYEYFRDRTVTREAVKAGTIDYFAENSAKDWATTFDTPALRDGMLQKGQFLNSSYGRMQAFFMNARRPPFDDRLVRQALAYAFDFAWTNDHIYYGAYLQPASFFAPTELASSGLPQGEELEILERYRGRIPNEVFTEVYQPPETDGSGWPRENLSRALELLARAGWVQRDLKLVREDTGEQMSFEFLYQQKSLERAILPFVRNLNRIGIDVRLRLVDTSQYINRLREFDYDMVISGNAQSLSPGNEQREFWSSAAADQPGSRNLAGIKDPVIDELIELVIQAPDRDSLIARTRALDRVLLWGHYVVPQLISPYERIVYWNKFGRPEVTPMSGPSPLYWWIDREKAAQLEAWRGKSREAVPAAESGTSTVAWVLGAAVLGLLAVVVLYTRRHRTRSAA